MQALLWHDRVGEECFGGGKDALLFLSGEIETVSLNLWLQLVAGGLSGEKSHLSGPGLTRSLVLLGVLHNRFIWRCQLQASDSLPSL